MKTNLKTQFSIAMIAIISMLSFSACKKDKVSKYPTAAQFKALHQQAFDDLVQSATFDAEDGITFVSDSGAILVIPPNAFTDNSVPVTGPVDLEFVEIYDSGNMAACDAPTMGILPDGKRSMLVSGGEFNIAVRKGGKMLTLVLPMDLSVPVENSDNGGLPMQLFKDCCDSDDDGDGLDKVNGWELLDDGTGHNVKFIDRQDSLTGEYEIFYNALVNELGWTNIDRFHSDPRPKTTMQVKAPEGYDYSNCAIYLKYKGEESGLARLDTYDPTTKIFSEHYGQIPIGLECYLIFCSTDGEDWVFSSKLITITANTTYDVNPVLTTGKKKTYTGHVTLLK